MHINIGQMANSILMSKCLGMAQMRGERMQFGFAFPCQLQSSLNDLLKCFMLSSLHFTGYEKIGLIAKCLTSSVT